MIHFIGPKGKLMSGFKGWSSQRDYERASFLKEDTSEFRFADEAPNKFDTGEEEDTEVNPEC